MLKKAVRGPRALRMTPGVNDRGRNIPIQDTKAIRIRLQALIASSAAEIDELHGAGGAAEEAGAEAFELVD